MPPTIYKFGKFKNEAYRHMFSLMSEHLLEQNIISDNQWGFTSNKSITTALLALTHDRFKHLEAGNEVCVVFLDLQKAIDSVPHLLVVTNSGLYPILLKWICSYLTDRSQRGGWWWTVLHLLKYMQFPVFLKVLGPLLSIIYINGITDLKLSTGCKRVLYADDIMVYKPI